jgi:hypothetical protein
MRRSKLKRKFPGLDQPHAAVRPSAAAAAQSSSDGDEDEQISAADAYKKFLALSQCSADAFGAPEEARLEAKAGAC